VDLTRLSYREIAGLLAHRLERKCHRIWSLTCSGLTITNARPGALSFGFVQDKQPSDYNEP